MKRKDFVVGELYEVIGNTSMHGFNIGDIVVAHKPPSNNVVGGCRFDALFPKDKKDWWMVSWKDLTPLSLEIFPSETELLINDFKFHCGYSQEDAIFSTECVIAFDFI